MHFTEFWSIVERDREIQNPSSPEKLLLLADDCRVRDGLRVLDVGCGKAWLLRTWAARWAIDGTGLEINPHFLAEAREQAARAGVAERLRFVEGPALDFTPQPASYDLVMCIGATFALGSLAEAVAWMRRAIKPDGVLAVGELFWRELPPPPELLAERFAPGVEQTLEGVTAELAAQGFALHGLIAASTDDWDRWASLGWRAVREWASAHPAHPARAEMLQRLAADRARYLRWERRFYGWAIFVAAPELAAPFDEA